MLQGRLQQVFINGRIAKDGHMDRYHCPECSYTYNEDEGDLREGYESGTRWEDVDEEFYCPDCGIVAKVDFEKLQ